MTGRHFPRHFVVDGHPVPAAAIEPGLHLVATPIGNLWDVSLRALSTLAAADRIYCEDTRVSQRLLDRYRIEGAKLKPYHDHNAARVRPQILTALAEGQAVALISDAGTPLISDPGYKLVQSALEAGIPVHMVPGPSAPLMALALSGLPADRFHFIGFLPAKGQARRAALGRLKSIEATAVCFETAPRIRETLIDIAEVLGDPPVALARELTKLHEEVLRGRASEVARLVEEWGGLKGEITLVIAPVRPPAEEGDIDRALQEALAELPAAKAAALIARRFGLPKSDLYRRAVALKGETDAEG